MKICSIICNRHGGKGITDLQLSKITKMIENYNYKVDMHFTNCPKDATNIVKKLPEVDLVISIGGDGTFGEVIAGNVIRKKPLLLSHLPNGTTNDIGIIYGMNKTMMQNLKNVLEGKIMEIDIPTINGRPFIYVCGFGKFLNIPYETPQQLKKKIGHAAYLWCGFKDFFHKLKSHEVKCSIDGKTFTGKYTMFIISNSTSVAGFRNFYKSVDLNDGKVEVAMIYSKTRNELIPILTQLVLGGVDNVKNGIKYEASEVVLEFKDSVTWDVDGEKLDDESKVFTIKVTHKINLLVPKP